MSHRRLALAALTAAAIALALPAGAAAHTLGGRRDLPIPVWLFGLTAAIVLVASLPSQPSGSGHSSSAATFTPSPSGSTPS